MARIDSSPLAALTRRALLQHGGISLGAIALAGLLNEGRAAEPVASADPLAPRPSHFAAKAKSVIYLHMVGAPSQLDLFDFKAELVKRDGQLCPQEFLDGQRFAFLRGHPKLMGTQFKFARHGRGEIELSELLPELAKVADELAVIKTVHTEEFNHGPAQLFLHTGFGRLGRPSFGSWVTYGLGSECRDLPAYVVMITGAMAGAGSSLWSSGFLPSVYQGIQFRTSGEPVLFLSNPKDHTPADRRRVLDTIADLNREQLADVGDPEIATRINQYELAYRMQTSVPELMDLSRETAGTLTAYGATPGKASFANDCLLARRLVERGVRIVELFDEGWDHHSGIAANLPRKCKQTDKPIAALLSDLRQRGLLDETLVIFGGEFGRTPMLQSESGDGRNTASGRDHHKGAFTMWLAGGGIKGGLTWGRTDDLGYTIAEHPVHVHDLNATVLHLLGLDHTKLTFKYQGRQYRLTDVHGNVVKEILT
jgi:uncharacterized protein (DUF1501 family)